MTIAYAVLGIIEALGISIAVSSWRAAARRPKFISRNPHK